MTSQKSRFNQVDQFATASYQGDVPDFSPSVCSSGELRFRSGLATMPVLLQSHVTRIARMLYQRDHFDRARTMLAPSRFYRPPYEFFRIGNILLAYIADRLPELIKPYESESLPLGDTPSIVSRIKARSRVLISQFFTQEFIAQNRDLFNIIDEAISHIKGVKSSVQDAIKAVL